MYKKSFGNTGENSAAMYLSDKGYHIIARNVYVGHSEVDIIAQDGNFLVFVEVKTRRQYPDRPDMFGRPSDRVDERKKNALIRAALEYTKTYPLELTPRIDVIEVYIDPLSETYKVLSIRHFENAVKKKGKFSGGRMKNSSF